MTACPQTKAGRATLHEANFDANTLVIVKLQSIQCAIDHLKFETTAWHFSSHAQRGERQKLTRTGSERSGILEALARVHNPKAQAARTSFTLPSSSNHLFSIHWDDKKSASTRSWLDGSVSTGIRVNLWLTIWFGKRGMAE
jgi:hypothetical protein